MGSGTIWNTSDNQSFPSGSSCSYPPPYPPPTPAGGPASGRASASGLSSQSPTPCSNLPAASVAVFPSPRLPRHTTIVLLLLLTYALLAAPLRTAGLGKAVSHTVRTRLDRMGRRSGVALHYASDEFKRTSSRTRSTAGRAPGATTSIRAPSTRTAGPRSIGS